VAAIEAREKLSAPYPPGFEGGYDELPLLTCIQAIDRFDCMQRIGNNEADLVQLEPGIGYTAGEYYNMLPIMAEKYVAGQTIKVLSAAKLLDFEK
jgi:hypothetical protein